MNTRVKPLPHLQRGVVLVSSLLLLLVVTIMALSMFRSFGIQEKVAGNMREKQRALQAAVSAQTYAEQWLISNSATSAPVTCNALLSASASTLQGQICSNKLWLSIPVGTTVATVPWAVAGTANVGVTYLPAGMNVSTTASNNSYYGAPTFYISDAGASADPNVPGEIYQIDAFGYGGNNNTAAVVESTYAVYSSSSNKGGL